MIYRAHFVLPITRDPIESGEVLVRDGKIQAIGLDLAASLPDEPVEDLGHAVILPGLVNVHTHLDYTIMRNMVENQPFFPWIRRLTELGGRLDYEDWLASARLGALQLIRSGVTCIGDSTFSGAVVEAAKEAGLCGTIYLETFGSDPSAEYEQQVEALAERVHELNSNAGDRVSVGVSPHSVYTSSEKLLRLVIDLVTDEGLPVALHVAETQEEIAFIKNAEGLIADYYKTFNFDLKARGKTPVEYLHELGLPSSKTVAAHCVHVTEADLDILAEEQVRVAHCPKSNAKLGVGTAPLTEIVQRGIITGIGTDSAASDDNLDMFEEMRFAVLAQRAVKENVEAMNAQRVLELATMGGAAVLGLDLEIGSLEPGKQADMIAVDLSSPSVFPSTDPYSALVYGCSASDVLMTMIDGEIVYRAGKYSRVDSGEIKRQAALSATKLY